MSSLSSVSLPPYDSHLSMCHINIQSIVPKLDILQYEAQPFDVFIFTETWLNDSVNSEEIKLINFKDPFRCDRDTRSGGVAIYVKETLNCVRRPDLEINGLESVWLQLSVHSRKILICGIYRPPNSPFTYWNLIHESFDRARNTNIQDIFILGDFNNDMLNAAKSRNLQDLITFVRPSGFPN